MSFAGWCVYRASEAKQRAESVYVGLLRRRCLYERDAERARQFAEYAAWLVRFEQECEAE